LSLCKTISPVIPYGRAALKLGVSQATFDVGLQGRGLKAVCLFLRCRFDDPCCRFFVLKTDPSPNPAFLRPPFCIWSGGSHFTLFPGRNAPSAAAFSWGRLPFLVSLPPSSVPFPPEFCWFFDLVSPIVDIRVPFSPPPPFCGQVPLSPSFADVYPFPSASFPSQSDSPPLTRPITFC